MRLLPRLMPDPIVTSAKWKSENRVPGLRLRSVVAVMAWMAAPKGSVKAFATRRRAPEKVYTVLWDHGKRQEKCPMKSPMKSNAIETPPLPETL